MTPETSVPILMIDISRVRLATALLPPADLVPWTELNAAKRAILEKKRVASGRGDGKPRQATYALDSDLAVIATLFGFPEQGAKLMEKAFSGLVRTLGKDDATALAATANFAFTLARFGDWPGALSLSLRALEGREATLGPSHELTAEARRAFAESLLRMGDSEGALKHYDLALREAGKFPAGKDDGAKALLGLGDALAASGDHARAEETLARALEALSRPDGSWHVPALEASVSLGLAESALGKHGEAVKRLDRTLGDLTGLLGCRSPLTARATNALGRALAASGRLQVAASTLKDAVATSKQSLTAAHPDSCAYALDFASVLEKQGKAAKAERWIEQAVYGLKKFLGKEHPTASAALKRLDAARGAAASRPAADAGTPPSGA